MLEECRREGWPRLSRSLSPVCRWGRKPPLRQVHDPSPPECGECQTDLTGYTLALSKAAGVAASNATCSSGSKPSRGLGSRWHGEVPSGSVCGDLTAAELRRARPGEIPSPSHQRESCSGFRGTRRRTLGSSSRMGCLPGASRPARRDESISNARRLGYSPHPRRNSRHWRRSPVAGHSPAPVPPPPEQLRNRPVRPLRQVRRAIRGAVDPPAIGVAIHGIVGMRIHRHPRSVASLPARGRTLPRPRNRCSTPDSAGAVRRTARGQPVVCGPDMVRLVRSARPHRDVAPAAWPPPPRSSWTGWTRTR